MESCAAELVIYVPRKGLPSLGRDLIGVLARRVPPCEGPIALASSFGGTIVLRDPEAPYGNPYGVCPDALPRGVDADLHVSAHAEWEAIAIWIRRGVRSERACGSNDADPLMSRDDLERILAGPGREDLETRLRAFFGKPPPSYDVGKCRVVIDWDGSVSEG